MHEVIVAEETIEAVKAAQAEGRSTWRVSSTLFSHIASDELLEPLGNFKTNESLELYPPIHAGDFVSETLKRINLFGNK